MTTHLFSEEPADGAILANEDITEIRTRNDNADRADGDCHWIGAEASVVVCPWEDMTMDKWQRLYRQSDVDQAVAEAVERLRAELSDAMLAQRDLIHNDARLYGSGSREGGLEEAARIARTHGKAEGR